MNIAFFLLPKDEVKFLNPEATLRQALEKMKYHRYTSVPLINEQGQYVGTLTEGDLLWFINNALDEGRTDVLKAKLKDVPQRVHNVPVSINAEVEDLLTLAIDQNFIPVEDDQKSFIGIIRRRDIIKFTAKLLYNQNQNS
ncbi:CBS domain-containing protein [Numidum massiliense]|uniref:CBS domain-containing protein n=1 Tax=Numidum massiliense TaxID=1522315 RepID=UPI0006D5B264|nr:CBS domain-containing protein [Numidum massiliense]